MYLPKIRNHWSITPGSESTTDIEFVEFNGSYENKWRCLLCVMLNGKVVLPPLSS